MCLHAILMSFYILHVGFPLESAFLFKPLSYPEFAPECVRSNGATTDVWRESTWSIASSKYMQNDIQTIGPDKNRSSETATCLGKLLGVIYLHIWIWHENHQIHPILASIHPILGSPSDENVFPAEAPAKVPPNNGWEDVRGKVKPPVQVANTPTTWKKPSIFQTKKWRFLKNMEGL